MALLDGFSLFRSSLWITGDWLKVSFAVNEATAESGAPSSALRRLPPTVHFAVSQASCSSRRTALTICWRRAPNSRRAMRSPSSWG